jgi:membrane protease YdiL (CAAX protease family)
MINAPAPNPRYSYWLRPELVGSAGFVVWVVVVMLGSGIGFAAVYGATHRTGDFLQLLSDRFFLMNTVIEAALLGLLLLVLHRRGWKPSDFRIRLGVISTFQGVAVLVVTYLGIVAVMSPITVLAKMPHAPAWLGALVPKLDLPPGGLHLNLAFIGVFLLLNAFYEELTYMGFTFNQVASRMGPNWAIVVTVLLRLLIHTYQGASHMLQIGIWALIFGLAYRWIGKVWPLIFAHACLDLISFAVLLNLARH